MGQVTITISGSFPHTSTQKFTASTGGHAMCLQQAIRHLLLQMPSSIQRDHELHEKNVRPTIGFGREVASG